MMPFCIAELQGADFCVSLKILEVLLKLAGNALNQRIRTVDSKRNNLASQQFDRAKQMATLPVF